MGRGMHGLYKPSSCLRAVPCSASLCCALICYVVLCCAKLCLAEPFSSAVTCLPALHCDVLFVMSVIRALPCSASNP